MDSHSLKWIGRKCLATSFATALMFLSMNLVICVGADGHFAFERSSGGCCPGEVSTSMAGDSAHVEYSETRDRSNPDSDLFGTSNACVDCSDLDLSSTALRTTGLSALSPPTTIAATTPIAITLPVALRQVELAPRRVASLEFARVISLRC